MLGVSFGLTASVPSSVRDESKTTLAPSGDHCGSKLSAPMAVVLVIGARPLPSVFTRQMLDVPFGPTASVPSSLRLEWKTTLDKLNRAPTSLGPSITTVHVPVPEQLPDQPVKSEPAAGAAVSTMLLPAPSEAVHLGWQSICPARFELTMPEPLPTRLTESGYLVPPQATNAPATNTERICWQRIDPWAGGPMIFGGCFIRAPASELHRAYNSDFTPGRSRFYCTRPRASGPIVFRSRISECPA